MHSHDCLIIGAGQAGLAASHELAARGIDHVVLERGRVGQTWRGYWDTFCLVTPNWSVQLPGQPYDGDDPDGFMPRDQLVAYLERYAAAAPVEEGVEITSLGPDPAGGLRLETSTGQRRARTVVVATGAYQRLNRPAALAGLDPDLPVLDARAYGSPSALPPGKVLVVGSGQTGCQIADELRRAGREVFLACGKAPWTPRRLGGRDVFWWVQQIGFLDAPLSSLPSPAARLGANVQASGHHGGCDLNYRTLQQLGVTLLGRLVAVDGRRARFAPDLDDSVAWGDQRCAELVARMRQHAAEHGLDDPAYQMPAPFEGRAPTEVDLTGFAAVLLAGGFRPDYGWIDAPGGFDALGFPVHDQGASAALPGLHFLGVHFLRKRKSSLLCGVGEDAAVVADQVAGRLGAA